MPSEAELRLESHKKEIRASIAKLYALRSEVAANVDKITADIASAKAIYEKPFGEAYPDAEAE